MNATKGPSQHSQGVHLCDLVGSLAVGGGSVRVGDVLLGIDLVIALDVAVGAGQSNAPLSLSVILAASL